MSDNSSDAWLQAWARASSAVGDSLLRRPDEMADRAFGLFARARTMVDSSGMNAADPDALSQDCAMLAAPVRNVRPGFVKAVYFTTKPTQLDRLLLSLVFMQILARLGGYEGPIAWLSFPAMLLNNSFFNQINSAFSAIEGVGQPLGKPIDWASEPTDESRQLEITSSPPAIYLGSSYPFRREDPDRSPDAFDAQYGLPMICLPSRAAAGLILRLSPTPLAPADDA
jgi:hypothetical protein